MKSRVQTAQLFVVALLLGGTSGSDVPLAPHPMSVVLAEREANVPLDEFPIPTTMVKPKYSELARKAGVEGTVVVDIRIDRDGRVLRAEVDPEFSNALLNEAALEAAKKWAFKPALVNGHPVAVWMALPFRFALRE